MLSATMAREAGDMLLAVGEAGVDVPRHDDHLPRRFLLRLFVTREISAHMTGIALHSQPDTKRAHRIH